MDQILSVKLVILKGLCDFCHISNITGCSCSNGNGLGKTTEDGAVSCEHGPFQDHYTLSGKGGQLQVPLCPYH